MAMEKNYTLDDEEISLVCKWHCLLCGRHFADEKAFLAHYETPGNFGGCRKPQGKEGRYAILCDTEGTCHIWSNHFYAGRGDWRTTPRRDVRVYMSEDW